MKVGFEKQTANGAIRLLGIKASKDESAWTRFARKPTTHNFLMKMNDLEMFEVCPAAKVLTQTWRASI